MDETKQPDQTLVGDTADNAAAANTEENASEPDRTRRSFLSGLATLAVGAGVGGVVAASNNRKAVKNKILSRIHEEMDNEYLKDPLQYHSSGYSEYTKEAPAEISGS